VTAPPLALPAGIDAEVLAAAALAEQGPLDLELAECKTCGQPAIAHDDDEHPHEPTDAWLLARAAQLAADREVLDDIVEHLDAGYVPSGQFGPRVSDAGACPRAVWYRERPPAGYTPREDIDRRRAALGTLIHQAAEAARSARYPWRRYEMTVAIPGLDKPGRVDEYDPVLGLVIDDKTAGRAKWDMIGEDGPTAAQWSALRIYAYALDAAGYPVRLLRIIAINRDTGEEEHFDEEYDPAAGLAALDELVAVATMIEAGVTPPRAGYGPRDWRCQWCEALHHCWQTERAKELGRSPESLIALGEHPEDPSIAWAARAILDLSRERLALEKREKRAKALVQGIKPDVYGKDSAEPVEVYDDWSTSYGYKDAYEKAAALLEVLAALVPEDQRPDLAEVTVERKRTRNTAVRRPKDQRAAARRPRKPKGLPAAEAAGEQLAAQLTPEA
jgi:CRISPR/Cas system-associated exonuclease Cas4 (RecB family)